MRKFICFLLTTIMIITCIPQGIVLAEELPKANSLLTLDNTTLYANGNSVYIKKDQTGNIYAYDSEHGTKLLEDNLNKVTTIYGGSKNKNTTGAVNITLDGVRISYIYGGGFSDGSASADLHGDVFITIKGNVDVNSVYGGGYAKADKGYAQADIYGDITIQIPAIPTSNHYSITGGGYAVTSQSYHASANVYGNITMYVVGRTQDIRGGGFATTNSLSTGKASANVTGSIKAELNQVDVRDVYCGGYANYNAIADVQDIEFKVYGNSEVASLTGGGYSSNRGQANARNVVLNFDQCINLYAYLYGGGQAYSGGTSNVNRVDMRITNSLLPAYEQRPGWGVVSASVFAGGNANGTGSKANVETASLRFEDNETAATLYGGGEADADSQALVGTSNSYYKGNTPSEFEDELYASTAIAGGSGAVASTIKVGKSNITVLDSVFDGIWGGNEYQGNPVAMDGNANLDVKEELSTRTIANFSTITMSAPLHTELLIGKTTTLPTELIVPDTTTVGTALVYCDDTQGMQDTFSITNNKLEYAIKENKSVWSLGQMTYDIQTKSSAGGSVSASKTVNKFGSFEITWRANAEYELDKVLLDGSAISVTGSSYTLANIQSIHTIEVVFRKIPGIVDDIVEVPKKPDVPSTSVELDKDKVTELLTEEDKAAIADGKSIKFALDVEKVKDVPKEVASIIETIVDKENVLLHLNIDFTKDIDGDKTTVREAKAAIRIVIAIPKEFIDAKGDKEFAILRTHLKADGTYETMILKDLDDDPATITFETDRFSLYSLVYDVPREELPEIPIFPIEPENPIAPENPTSSLEPNHPNDANTSTGTPFDKVETGDATGGVQVFIYIGLMGYSLSGIFLVWMLRKYKKI